MATRYFILVDHQPVPCTQAEWVAWVQDPTIRRSMTTTVGTEKVTTEFPGYSRNEEPLFRTSVFGFRCAGLMAGYHTYEAAMEGHRAMVQRVKSELGKPIE